MKANKCLIIETSERLSLDIRERKKQSTTISSEDHCAHTHANKSDKVEERKKLISLRAFWL